MLPAYTVRLLIAASTGALLVSSTVTMKVLVLLVGGVLLSVTITEMPFVLGPCASVGVQRKTPVAGFTLALAGAPAAQGYRSKSWA